jgi:murein L,D-transpeptidase YafK
VKKAWISALCLMIVGTAVWALYPTKNLSPYAPIDKVIVLKDQRLLRLIKNEKSVATYRISLGRQPSGAKNCLGDNRTPEGHYVLDWHNPQSICHLSLHVSYPDAKDSARARQLGCSPGGDIMIHGMSNGLGLIGKFHRFIDWTSGCIAVTDAEMEQIYNAVPNGTPIEIFP